ncbi:hypothetical protein [Neokomagataea anthophila]|uniref:DUF1515 domain-containing protein n=1 Tax=Neokomagataea anthophila TaxID=2826925 RepID=A0ABS5E803_9PROT|nr:hypothetical protein [Neokomagataea anthophila]MBR0560030.1 hypothetical protein [Neokomagataea anthophila]
MSDEFITRGEFSERFGSLQTNVKELDRDVTEIRTTQNAQSAQLAKILTNQETQDRKLDALSSTRHTIRLVLVLLTSTGAMQWFVHWVGAR